MKHHLLTLSLSFLLASLSASAQPISLPKETPQLQEKWKRFRTNTARGLEDFVTKNINPTTNEIRTVFYPFGGPDITYPFLVFPKATQFTIVGLEFPGDPANIETISSENSYAQVESLLTRSFFITSQMSKQLTKQTGVLAPLFLQLKLLGVQEVSVSAPDLPYRGVKITFNHEGLEKTIHYYKMDLNDSKAPEQFLNDLNNQGLLQACLIKSSSYIPHQRNFHVIRDFIRTHASLIVQDDSGIPYKLLKKDYDVKVFGQYKGPYGAEFANYLQKDLPSGDSALSFCFGYGCRRQYSVVLLAQKKPLQADISQEVKDLTQKEDDKLEAKELIAQTQAEPLSPPLPTS